MGGVLSWIVFVCKRSLLLVSLMILLSSAAEASWWDADFHHRLNLTIDSSFIDSDIEDFPLLVKLNSSNFNFSAADEDGHDIRILDSEESLLDFERSRHDAEDEEAEYWVSVPSISAEEDTLLYVYYGNEEASDASSPSTVWNDDFVGVWHMGEDTATETFDSTGDNDGTFGGNLPTTIEGKTGYAQDFFGADYISAGTVGATTAGGTISLWVQIPDRAADYERRFIGHVDPVDDWDNRLFIGDSNDRDFDLYIGLGDTWDLDTNILVPPEEEWFHVALAWEETSAGSGDYWVYFDGAEVSSGTYSGLDSLAGQFDIGNTGHTEERGVGDETTEHSTYIDEVRWANTPLSADWIRASYHSEDNSLIDYGGMEEIPRPRFVEHVMDDNILLNPGSSVEVDCSGVIESDDGYSDIDTVSAVFQHESYPGDGDDRALYYEDEDCTTIDTEFNGEFECSFDVYFFASPGDWTCSVTASNTLGVQETSNVSTYIEEMVAISSEPQTLDFGTLAPGTDTGTEDFTSEIYNLGNTPLGIDVRTFDSYPDGEHAMNCSVDYLPFDNLRFAIDTGIDVHDRTPASILGVDSGLAIDPQEGEEAQDPTSSFIHWGVIVPDRIAGTCQGHIRYTASSLD